MTTLGRLYFALVSILSLSLPLPALAQQTGSVSGAVFEPTGVPVVGATVRISGTPRTTSFSARLPSR